MIGESTTPKASASPVTVKGAVPKWLPCAFTLTDRRTPEICVPSAISFGIIATCANEAVYY